MAYNNFLVSVSSIIDSINGSIFSNTINVDKDEIVHDTTLIHSNFTIHLKL